LDKKNHAYTAAEKDTPEYRAHFQRDVYTFFSAGLKDDLRIKAMSGSNPPLTAVDLRRVASTVEAQADQELSHKAAISEIRNQVEEGEREEDEGNLEVNAIRGRQGFRRGGNRGRGNNQNAAPRRGRGGGGFQQRRGGNQQFRGGRGRGQNRTQLNCFNCQGYGHYSFECSSEPRNRQNPQNFRGGFQRQNGQNAPRYPQRQQQGDQNGNAQGAQAVAEYQAAPLEWGFDHLNFH
jgi:hypothetical protein